MEARRRRRRRTPPAGRAETEPGAERGVAGSLLLVTGQEQLCDDVALIAAVIGAPLECRQSWAGVQPGRWAAMMCGTDAPPPSARLAAETILLGAARLWEVAAAMPGLRAVPLPEGEAWLSEHLSACVLDRMPGQVAAVAAAFGGAGATTFAYLMAGEAVARGRRVLLVDGDPQPGSGVRTLVRAAEAEGTLGGPGDRALDWSRIQEIDGDISAAQLEAALPDLEGIRVMTAGPDPGGADPGGSGLGSSDLSRGGPDTATAEAVVRAGRRVFDLVVVDACRNIGLLSGLAGQVGAGLIVTEASSRGADGAEQIARQAADAPLALVVNGGWCRGWSAAEVGRAVGLPVLADCAEQRWLRIADGPGEAYELLRTKRGAALVSGLLETVGVDA